MDVLGHLALGFGTALTPIHLGLCFAGVLLGTLIGVLPGIGPISTIALLLPFTFSLSPTAAVIMLAGIYYGAQYGGAITAILVNLPGEASSAVTCIDGHVMARQGRAGLALTIAALGSFVGGTAGTVFLAALSTPLAMLAARFEAADHTALMVCGLVAAIVLAHGSVLKAIAMLIAGLLLGAVGSDVTTGQARFTLGIPELLDGIGFVPLAIGLFGLAEMMVTLASPGDRHVSTAPALRLRPHPGEARRAVVASLRGTALGSVLGVLPGGGPLIASFASYAIEKRLSSGEPRVGMGAVEGIAGPESANNAAAQTSFVPLLTLGLPSNGVMALLLGALIVHGIQPGPDVIAKEPALFWGLVASMWIGNVMLLVLNLPLVGAAAACAVPLALSDDHCPFLRGHLRAQSQYFRVGDRGSVWRARVSLTQARLRAGAAPARIRAEPAHRGERAPCPPLLERRSNHIRDTSDQRHAAGDRGPVARLVGAQSVEAFFLARSVLVEGNCGDGSFASRR